ncbi:hypothetical protein [Lactiplantibacillus brownii]
MSPKLAANQHIDGNRIQIELNIRVGSKTETQLPFSAMVEIEGSFDYHPDEDKTSKGITTFVRDNAVAILYPYARALIAQLTLSSNEFPGYNLPTINVPEALKLSDLAAKS